MGAVADGGVPAHQVFGALGDPSRLDLVALLLQHGPATATELAAHLAITRQAVAKHLGVLAEATIVAARREGRHVRYSLQPAQLEAAQEWLARTSASWEGRLDALDALVQSPDRR